MIKVYPELFSPSLTQELITIHSSKGGQVPVRCPNNPSVFDDSVFLQESDLQQIVHKKIQEVLWEYLDSCYYMNSNFSSALELGDIFVYRAGTVGCSSHFDSVYSNEYLRYLIFSVYLNSVQGGEFVFPQQNLVISSVAGTAILFPSFFTYPHFTNPSSECRYMLRVDVLDKKRHCSILNN